MERARPTARKGSQDVGAKVGGRMAQTLMTSGLRQLVEAYERQPDPRRAGEGARQPAPGGRRAGLSPDHPQREDAPAGPARLRPAHAQLARTGADGPRLDARRHGVPAPGRRIEAWRPRRWRRPAWRRSTRCRRATRSRDGAGCGPRRIPRPARLSRRRACSTRPRRAKRSRPLTRRFRPGAGRPSASARGSSTAGARRSSTRRMRSRASSSASRASPPPRRWLPRCCRRSRR